jgi:hypothetical protein
VRFDLKLSSLIPLAAVGLRLASSSTAEVSYVLVAGYALLGRAQAIQALALSWLFSMLNEGLVPATGVASIGRYAVLAAATSSVILWNVLQPRQRKNDSMVVFTIFLGCLFIIHSLLFSAIVDVSLLKAVSWTMAMGTLLSAWAGLMPAARDRLSGQIFGGMAVLMLASLPLIVMPVGYKVNGTGFQGVLAHPQAFGPTMALLGAWAASQMFSRPRPPWLVVGLLVACMVLVVRSEARTAGIALIVGVTTAVLLAPNISGRSIRQELPGLRSARTYAVAGLAFAAILLFGTVLEEQLETYLNKRNESTSIVEGYEKSRGGLIEAMWANIEANPWRGLGFGIASEPGKMVIQRDPILGLPMGAVIEKGVLPIAVIEEVGLLGLVIVMFWIALMLRQAAAAGVTQFSVCMTALLLNLGEYTLFSPGGMGLLSLILIGWSVTHGGRNKPRQSPNR